MTDDWESLYASGAYRELWHADLPSAQLITVVAAGLAGKSKCLDLGCGAGTQVLYLASRGLQAVGIDAAPSAVAIAAKTARAQRAEAGFLHGSALSLPFATDSFGFVTDRGCLHVIDRAAHPKYASEVARVIQPGGYFMLEGVREGAGRGFVPLFPDALRQLFSPWFTVGPIEPFTGVANVGSLEMWLMIARRSAAVV
jgi:SAM-dependent methyltransferase